MNFETEYSRRVRALELEGMSTSDAQGIADMEDLDDSTPIAETEQAAVDSLAARVTNAIDLLTLDRLALFQSEQVDDQVADEDAAKCLAEYDDAIAAITELSSERDRLHALVNNPQTALFLEAVRTEVAHQVERWGTVHDRAKEPADWFWLVGYLAGKALRAHIDGDQQKALHHTISTAAVLANWHAHVALAGGGFTPGASDLQKFLEDHFGGAEVAAFAATPVCTRNCDCVGECKAGVER